MNILAYVHLRNIVASTGAGRVARQMTESLAKQPGVNLRVLADSGDHRKVLETAGSPWTEFAYHLFSNDTSRQQARWWALQSPSAESYWDKADITYCTAESYVPTERTKLVVTLHDAAIFEGNAHEPSRSLWKQRLKWNLLYRMLDRKVDMFHTVSQFSAERIGHYFPNLRGRLRVIPNAVTSRFFGPEGEDGQRYLAENGLSGQPYVFVPGGLHYRKNAELILAAWPMIAQRHPGLQLVIANHSNASYAARVAALGDRVRLSGFVSDEAQHSLYCGAALVWFPSRYEGFGMPALEAMACGTPVLTSNSSSFPEVTGGAALMASAEDPADHVETICELLGNPARAAELRRLGRSRAAEFTWQRSAQCLAGHFQELL